MQGEDGGKLGGDVEVGNLHRRQVAQYARLDRLSSWHQQAAVDGRQGRLLSRQPEKGESRIRLRVIKGRKQRDAQPSGVPERRTGSNLYTDAFASYYGMDRTYVTRSSTTLRRTATEPSTPTAGKLLVAPEAVHQGDYVSVEPFHLFRYLDEQAFRFNNWKLSDAARFALTAAAVVGKRLTFRAATGSELPGTC